MIALAFALAAAVPNNSELTSSEREVDKQFSLAVQRLQNCRANTTKCYYWRRAIPRLQREQTAWKTWRDAKAALMVVEMEGTSGERELTSYFKSKLNRDRASELSKIGRR